MLEFEIIPVTAFQQNCSVVWCTATRRCAIVDPGGQIERIDARIQALGLSLERILITHGHIDHAGGAAQAAVRHGVPIEGPHADDAFWIDAMEAQGVQFGLRGGQSFKPDRWLEHGDHVQIGEARLDVLHCPGHTPGHVVFHHAASQLAWVGDVLFSGSIGRTDFPRGDFDTLVDAIRGRLWPLGDEVRFIPGHGPMSSFGVERRQNPYVRG